MSKKQKLILITGHSGSGKSTKANEINANGEYEHFEADSYFIKDGVYQFDSSKLLEAHNECQKSTMDALVAGKDVIVSNTFTMAWEREPYITMFKAIRNFKNPDIELEVIELKNEFKNVHGVPEETIAKQKSRYEPFSLNELYTEKELAAKILQDKGLVERKIGDYFFGPNMNRFVDEVLPHINFEEVSQIVNAYPMYTRDLDYNEPLTDEFFDALNEKFDDKNSEISALKEMSHRVTKELEESVEEDRRTQAKQDFLIKKNNTITMEF